MRYIVKYKIPILISVVLLFIGFCVWYWIYTTTHTSRIIIEFTPLDSQVKINGKKASSVNKVAAGEYTIEVSRTGFETYTEKLRVEKDEEDTVYAVLQPNTTETSDWYEKHPRDATKREQILSAQMTKESEEIDKSFPIVKILPYTAPRGAYYIDYGKGSRPNTQAVYISSYTDVGKQLALEYIKDMGYDIKDYEVIYKELTPEEPSLEHS